MARHWLWFWHFLIPQARNWAITTIKWKGKTLWVLVGTQPCVQCTCICMYFFLSFSKALRKVTQCYKRWSFCYYFDGKIRQGKKINEHEGKQNMTVTPRLCGTLHNGVLSLCHSALTLFKGSHHQGENVWLEAVESILPCLTYQTCEHVNAWPHWGK